MERSKSKASESEPSPWADGTPYTELCKIIPAKLGEFLPIFPKMADGQEEAGLFSLAALRRENSNMQESFYKTL